MQSTREAWQADVSGLQRQLDLARSDLAHACRACEAEASARARDLADVQAAWAAELGELNAKHKAELEAVRSRAEEEAEGLRVAWSSEVDEWRREVTEERERAGRGASELRAEATARAAELREAGAWEQEIAGLLRVETEARLRAEAGLALAAAQAAAEAEANAMRVEADRLREEAKAAREASKAEQCRLQVVSLPPPSLVGPPVPSPRRQKGEGGELLEAIQRRLESLEARGVAALAKPPSHEALAAISLPGGSGSSPRPPGGCREAPVGMHTVESIDRKLLQISQMLRGTWGGPNEP